MLRAASLAVVVLLAALRYGGCGGYGDEASHQIRPPCMSMTNKGLISLYTFCYYLVLITSLQRHAVIVAVAPPHLCTLKTSSSSHLASARSLTH
jgi:hypothetical protein